MNNAPSWAAPPRRVLFLAALLVVTACTTASERPDASPDTQAPIATGDDASQPTTSLSNADDETTLARADDDEVTTTVPEPLSGNYTVEIVSTRPHDPDAYTQGLELVGDRFIESTGLYGDSDRRLVDAATGEVLEIVELPPDLFGEGITVVESEVVQLTWQAGILLTADGATLAENDRGSYQGEGWGLCFDGADFVMSNGSSTLTRRSVDTFEIISEVTVIDGAGEPVVRLNELECVGDQVLANIWGLETIAVIDAATGTVDATIDAAALRPANAPADDLNYALNGIAFDERTGRYFLTGKWWDVIYEVELIPQGG